MTDFNEPGTLGRTGLKVGRLGVASGYGVPTASVEKAFHEYGCNYFFWATRKPGMREAIRNIARTDRDRLVLAIQSYDHSGFFVRRSVEKALRTVGLDRVDALILGWYNGDPRNRVLDSALALKEEGKVRFLGFSGHKRTYFGEVAKRSDSSMDIFMLRYNAAHRGAEKDIFPFLPEKGRPGITSYTATRWGKLLNPKKMPPDEKPLTSAECYRFVLTNPNVDVCLTGPSNAAHMDQALEALSGGPLSDEEMERVRRIGDHVHG